MLVEMGNYDRFKDILRKSKNIIALTGAGVSAESGIPTFRGEGGLWKTYRSADLATPHAFRAKPGLVWEFYNYRRHIAFNAQPNNAHKALAKYEEICKKQERKFTIITQNIDGLHQRAGSENVIELHGALHKVKCTKCKEVYEDYNNPICEALKNRENPAKLYEGPLVEEKDLPKCKHCQGLLRPYIVWFGENLNENVLKETRNLVENCDLCLVVGTSSVVYPAAMFAPLVAERGKPVAEFNIEKQPAHDTFNFYFQGECGTTLPKALDTSS